MLSASLKYVSRANQFDLRVARKVRKVLFRIGGYAQKVLQTSIKKFGGTTVPGTPPKRHIAFGGGLTYIRFDVSDIRSSSLIGVARTFPKNPQRRGQGTPWDRFEWYKSNKVTPKLLNESGVSQRTTQYIHSGNIYVELLSYRQYPITKYAPTLRVIHQKFADFIAAERL
jgi:hypothetical protein